MTPRDSQPTLLETAPGKEGLGGLFKLVLESIPSGLVVFDTQFQILLRNEVAKALLPDDDDISKALSRLAIESKYENWAAELHKVIETRRPKRFDVTVHRSEDQPDLYLDLTCSPLHMSTAGEVVGGLLLIEDVSSRIGMERRLAVSERLAAVGKLAARVAHELNNPLDGILRYTNLALRSARAVNESAGSSDVKPLSKLIEYLENAKVGLVRMTEITSSLLEFSRTTPGTFEQATINRIVEDAVTAMEGRARSAHVTVVCNFHEQDMPVIRGCNIFQVFCNIIKNAIDAMPDSGRLTITTRLIGPDVVVTFEDTGIGLPKEASKIFDPFFTTKPPGQGTGLGLAVCKELIEKYSGSISAERRQPRGTKITVRIPIRHCAPMGCRGSLPDSRHGAETAPDDSRSPTEGDSQGDTGRA